MALIGGSKVYSDPRTDQHLREVLARAQQNDSSAASSIVTLVGDVAVLESVIGLESATFDSTTVIGQPLYVSGADNVELADASALSTSNVIGLAYEDVTAAAAGQYLTHGILTQNVWTTVTGAINLTPGSKYYLSATTGLLTTTAPTSVGEVVVEIGTAIDNKSLSVNIQSRVRL